jgi:acetyl esterase
VPLDPHVEALLTQMRAMGEGRPQMHELPPAEAREAYIAFAALSGEAPAIASVVDDKAGDIPVRIYTPRGDAPFPVVVFLHGGGWVVGDLDTHDVMCRILAHEAGSVVVAVHYRLAPEHRYPAAAEDAHTAAVWAHEHAAEWGGDPGRMAVCGDSAGGNLSAVVALMARDRGGPPLRFQVLIYPVVDAGRNSVSYNDPETSQLLTREGMDWFWSNYLSCDDDATDPYCSPLAAADLKGLPPALVITAEYDPLRDEGEAYAVRLRDAGVEVTSHLYEGQVHGFAQVPGLFPAGHHAVKEVGAALKAALAT